MHKTAIQQLIDEMKKSPLMFASALILIDHMKLADVEKSQIISAYKAGKNGELGGEKYYEYNYKD